jgi:hypothetical protein
VPDEFTIDGLPSDAGQETMDNNPGYELAVLPHKSLTFTVHLTKVPAVARTMAFAMSVSLSSGNVSDDKQYWMGGYRGMSVYC